MKKRRSFYLVIITLFGMLAAGCTVGTESTGSQDYATMIRTKSLSDLATGKYEDVYHNFIGGGTPYYITRIDDFWYLTEHRIPGHSIWQFQVKENAITNVTSIY